MQTAGADISSATQMASESGQAFEIIVRQTRTVQEQMQQIVQAISKMQVAEASLGKSVTDAQSTARANHQAAADMDDLNHQIISSLDKVSEIIQQNRVATERITIESLEASQSIETIASVSEENSAAVEEISAATAEMNTQSEYVADAAGGLADMSKALRQAIEKFRTSETPQDSEDAFSNSATRVFLPYHQEVLSSRIRE